MNIFDVIVMGGGPGGYLAGARLGKAGFNTAVVEKRAFGGVCLNEGCIPSKAFLNSAKLYEHARESESFGVNTQVVSYSHSVVVERKDKVVNTLTSGVKAKLKGSKVTMIDGNAVIKGRTMDGYIVSVDEHDYLASKLIIATGSEAIVPPIPGVKEGLESGLVVTNREILDRKELPEKLVVIGGGVIGLEMASYFNSVGTTVTIIEMLDQIGGNIEGEISKELLAVYEKKGVKFELGSRVTGVGKDSVTYEKGGKVLTESADMVLLSVGRRASTSGIGLENIGVHTERGMIVTDEYMQTNIPGVYAVGDVNGKLMLAHTAYREAEVAVNNITGKRDRMRYSAIASVIYTTPEVGCVGETEKTAREKGIDYKTATIPMSYSGRYLAESDNPVGICKLIVNKKYNNLIGMHIMGSYASEIIYGAAMMIETEMKVDDLKQFVIPHPTVGEVIHDALYEL